MGKSSSESETPKGVKRSLDNASENHHDISPKVLITSRTRSRTAEETPKAVPVPIPRSSKSKYQASLQTPLTTPRTSTKEILSSKSKAPMPKTKTRRCRDITPENRDQSNRTRSENKTSITSEGKSRTTRSRSQTPVRSSTLTVPTQPRSRSNTPVSKIPRLVEPIDKASKSETEQESVIQNESISSRSSPRLNQTPKSSQIASTSKRQNTNKNTLTISKMTPRQQPVEKTSKNKTELENVIQKETVASRSSPRLNQTPKSSQFVSTSKRQNTNRNTPTTSKMTPRQQPIEKTSKSKTELENVFQKETVPTRSSPRLNQTPKLSQIASTSKRQNTFNNTCTTTKITPRQKENKTPFSSSSNTAISEVIQADKEKEISDESSQLKQSNDQCFKTVDTETSVHSEIGDKTSPAKSGSYLLHGDIDIDSLRICMPVSSQNTTKTSSIRKEIESLTASDAPEPSEELQEVVENVKKRRSTFGLGRRSVHSLGGRKSLCSTLPVMNLEDQIALIEKDLPHTSKISRLLDISIREATRRFEERFEEEDCVSDLKLEIITNSEKIGGHLAYQIADLPLEVEPLPKRTFIDTSKRFEKLEAYKKKTEKLEKEYKVWKALLKERKLACQNAEREFNEAKSGETSLDDDHMKHLTSVQRGILSSQPKYGQYIKEVQMARETAILATQAVNHTSSVIANFMKASKALADSCYAAVEQITLGSIKEQSSQTAIKTLLSLEDEF